MNTQDREELLLMMGGFALISAPVLMLLTIVFNLLSWESPSDIAWWLAMGALLVLHGSWSLHTYYSTD